MASAEADKVVRFLQYFLVDAKFYSIFSILFGIGFSIILNHAEERGNSGIRLFLQTDAGSVGHRTGASAADLEW